MTVLLPIAYTIVALFAVRPLAGHFAWVLYEHRPSYKRDSPYSTGRDQGVPDVEQWSVAILLALMVAVVWPVVLLARIGERWTIGAEKQAQIAQRERAIKEAEIELGIGVDE